MYYHSNDFGDIQIGCPQTPKRNNYYCEKHKNNNLTFNNGFGKISFLPKQIVWTRIKTSEI